MDIDGESWADPPCIGADQVLSTATGPLAMSIQEAIDAGTLPGRLVLVSNGVYATGGLPVHGSLTNRVVLTMGARVQSVNGPEVTIIEGAQAPGGGLGDGAIRCVYLGANTVLNGFTLTNGHTQADDFDSAYEVLGGGAWCEFGSVMTNCILIGNAALTCGGELGGTLYNSIVYDNTASWSGPDYSIDYTTLNFSCTIPLPTNGIGNITNEPAFLNAAVGDFRLAPGSPCIDAGTNLSHLITTDLNGNPRPLDGDGDGIAAFDMGAYEYVPPMPTDLVNSLMKQVRESGLAPDRQEPLLASLEVAYSSFDRDSWGSGMNQPEAFQNKVRAQVAPVDAALAEELIGLAQEIIDWVQLSELDIAATVLETTEDWAALFGRQNRLRRRKECLGQVFCVHHLDGIVALSLHIPSGHNNQRLDLDVIWGEVGDKLSDPFSIARRLANDFPILAPGKD